MFKRSDTELIWIDNGSSDGASDFVREHYPQAKVCILPENMGVAYARNRGVELSDGKFVLFLDDDTVASASVIETMMNYLETHPDVGIAGSALRDASGNYQDSFKGYPGLFVKVKNVIKSKLHINTRTVLPNHVIYPTYVIGACQLIRREVFDKIGLLDESIFYGPEDADFCIRAHSAGYLTAYLPHVSILHHYRRITSKKLNTPASRAHIRALRYFWRKHHRYI